MDIRKLSLRPDGMFSNINEVVQQLYLAEQNGYQFIIDWSKSCYREKERTEDPWMYYFEPCFPNVNLDNLDIETLPQLIGGGPIAFAKDNIITSWVYYRNGNLLRLPKDRTIGNRLIEKYITINETVRKKINDFRERNFHGYIIGLHIRGTIAYAKLGQDITVDGRVRLVKSK